MSIMSKQFTFVEETFAFFANFRQNRESLISRKISKAVIRESLFPRKMPEEVIRESFFQIFRVFFTRESFLL